MKIYFRTFLIASGVFIGSLLLTSLFVYQQHQVLQVEEARRISKELNQVANRLEKTLSNGLSATSSLAFIVEHYGIPENFDSLAHDLLQSHSYIDAIELTSKGVITHIYPLQGNEAAMGLDVLNDSLASDEAYKAIERRELYFAGPLKLRQGGMAVLGRLPIFKDNDFFGFSVVLIKLSTLFESIGINESNGEFTYQLSKINPQTKKPQFFIESPEEWNPSEYATITVPDGEWQLYVQSKESHQTYLFTISIIGGVLSTLLSLLTYQWSSQPEKLRRLINEKTKQLQQSEQYFKALIENSADAIWLLDSGGNVTYQSDSARKLIGYSIEDIGNFHLHEILHADNQDCLADNIRLLTETPGKVIHTRMQVRHKSSEFLWIEGSYTSLLTEPHVQAIVFNFRDVTDRINAQNAIIKERNMTLSIINSLPGIFYLYDKNRKFIKWNENFEKVTGYGQLDMYKKNPLDFFCTEEKPLIDEKIHEVFKTGSADVEANLLLQTGEKIPYFFTGTHAIIEDEEYLIGMGIDITKRKYAETKLMEAHKLNETTLNRISDAVVSLDREWRYTFLNNAALDTHPLPKEAILGKTILEVHPEMEGTIFWSTYQDAMFTNQAREVGAYYKPMDILFSVNVYPSKDGITIFYRNITDRKKIEKETLNSVGQELHDNVMQIMTAANMYLNVARNQTANPALDQAHTLIAQAVSEIRMLSHDLISPFISGESLKKSFNGLLKMAQDIGGLKTGLIMDETLEDSFSEKFKITLYRIAQEQINNVIKYANANTLMVSLKEENEQLIFMIRDDGVGFILNEQKGKGAGFLNMETRSKKFDGYVKVESYPGEGCKLTLIFPSVKEYKT